MGLSYSDVLLVPRKSMIESRRHVDTSTYITKGLKLNIPLVSANMDTVTESAMATAMAREGGLGIIHRFMDIEKEAGEVRKVKRAQSYIIDKPYSTGPRHNCRRCARIDGKGGRKRPTGCEPLAETAWDTFRQGHKVR